MEGTKFVGMVYELWVVSNCLVDLDLLVTLFFVLAFFFSSCCFLLMYDTS